MVAHLNQKVKTMPCMAVLDNLELEIFFVVQPWWATLFKKCFK